MSALWEKLTDRYVRRRLAALGVSTDLVKQDEDAESLTGERGDATEPGAEDSPVSDAKVSDKDSFYHWNGGFGPK